MTLEAILEATLQVLTRQGVKAFTTTLVAQRAGVSVGTLYQYFPDKRSLVAALTVRMLTRMKDAIAAASIALAGLSKRDALTQMVVTLVAFKRDNLQSVRALKESLAGPEGAGLLREVFRGMHQLVEPMVRDPLAARVLVAALDGTIDATLTEEPELLSDPAYVETLTRMAHALA